jgi:hypothetical protein
MLKYNILVDSITVAFLGCSETESTSYVSHYLAYCTSPRCWMMSVEQLVDWMAGETKSTGRKSAPLPLYSPQIPHDPTWARTRARAGGSQQLTASATAWHIIVSYCANAVRQAIWKKKIYETVNDTTLSTCSKFDGHWRDGLKNHEPPSWQA